MNNSNKKFINIKNYKIVASKNYLCLYLFPDTENVFCFNIPFTKLTALFLKSLNK